jgi:hypothetical protein
MTYVQLYQKYQTLPPEKQAEVDDFIEFLTTRQTAPVPVTRQKLSPVFGSAKGLFKIADDFDAPLDDFADYQ